MLTALGTAPHCGASSAPTRSARTMLTALGTAPHCGADEDSLRSEGARIGRAPVVTRWLLVRPAHRGGDGGLPGSVSGAGCAPGRRRRYAHNLRRAAAVGQPARPADQALDAPQPAGPQAAATATRRSAAPRVAAPR